MKPWIKTMAAETTILKFRHLLEGSVHAGTGRGLIELSQNENRNIGESPM